jgi:probable F420-dependent oxidoreductase
MRKARIAVQIQPQHASYRQLRDTAVRAEEMGADAVYTWDHFFPLFGDPDGRHLQCFTLLAAWAEATERVEIGSLVASIGYRNPNYLADVARTIDHISGGRMILGVGSGWYRRDYDEYGYEYGTAPGRLRDLEAALPVIRDRLGRLNPPPVRDVPIMIGGGGEKVTLRLVAEHADKWHTFADPDDLGVYERKQGVLEEWCARVGRDPGEIVRSVACRPSRLDLADRLAALGADEITLAVSGPDHDLGPVADWLAWADGS